MRFSSQFALLFVLALNFTFKVEAQSLDELEREILEGAPQTPTLSQEQNEVSDSLPEESSNWEASKSEMKEQTPQEKALVPNERQATTKPSDDDLEFEEVKAKESALEEVDEIIKGPRQIPFKHIFVVQPKTIRKKSTHELTPVIFGVQPSDSFRKQLQVGFSYIYNFTDSFGLEVLHIGAMTNIRTGLSSSLLKNARLENDRIEPVLSVGSALQWSPFKSKAATVENIYYFEGYLLAGGGYTKFESSGSGMIMGGGGVRVFLTPRAILKTEIRDYFDLDSGSDHRVNVLVGAAFLLGGEK